MNEYVCELPFDDVESFGSGNIQIPVHERVTRCRDCRFFWPGVSDGATDWCSRVGHGTTPYDFCSQGIPRRGGTDGDAAVARVTGGGASGAAH